MTFTISYEESSPSRARMAYYNAIAEKENFSIKWMVDNSDADAFLITGRELYHKLQRDGFTTIVSKNDERRMVALFGLTANKSQTLKLAGDFKWQTESAVTFLKKYLPQNRQAYSFEIITNDHSFDQRLKDLNNGLIDVMLCPLDDLNFVGQDLLKSMKYMVLPLFDCPPGIFQGCTGIYFKIADSFLVSKISRARDGSTSQRFDDEESLMKQHRADNFGVFSMELPLMRMAYMAIMDNGFYEYWKWDTGVPYPHDKNLFSTSDFMKDFFSYEYYPGRIELNKQFVFVTSHKAVQTAEVLKQLSESECRVWAAGSRTWLELARKGVWVEGCADGLGLEVLVKPWSGNFLHVAKQDVKILTNADSAGNWVSDGWNATSTYKLVPSMTPEIIAGLRSAEIVFWTSYQQYEACKQYLQPGVIHACPAGKTAVLLKKDGIKDPVVFPSIKAFNWFINSPPAKEG